jgi:hypothetical protein
VVGRGRLGGGSRGSSSRIGVIRLGTRRGVVGVDGGRIRVEARAAVYGVGHAVLRRGLRMERAREASSLGVVQRALVSEGQSEGEPVLHLLFL